MLPTGAASRVVIRHIVADGDAIRLDAEVIGDSAPCPSCQVVSFHVHDCYVRHPADLAWQGHPVRLALAVRRFECRNPACRRSTFAENCGDQLPPYTRRTRRAKEHLLEIVEIAGGEAGARLAAAAGLPVSPDTLLRLQRQAQLPAADAPRVLGVDDLALRRGKTYTTILVDLETSRPIDLLEGRDAQTLAKWLQAHPGVEVISRDRAHEYAEGASAGAPQAVQVADRFHLVQNASNALYEMLRGRRLDLGEMESSEVAPVGTLPASALGVERAEAPPPELPLSRLKRELAERQLARTARWEKVQALTKAGASAASIAREVGVSARTVRRLRARPDPARKRRENTRPVGLRSPMLQPYLTYLQDRWQAGCTNMARLFREIVARGYPGSQSLVRSALRAWRPPRPPKSERQKLMRLTSHRSLRWLCLRPPDQLKSDERVVLDRLLAQDAKLALGHKLLQDFRSVIASRDIDKLDVWLREARSSNLPTFAGLANGIVADRAAVEAALRLPWSNGPVEGQITRVKLIKRQGYGRAKFDLLRIRVLAA